MKSAERTLELFEAFADAKKALTLSELGRQMDIPLSTCFGLVRKLESLGYVYAIKPRGAFYPTKRLLDIARVISDNDPILERAEAVLRDLRDSTGETITLAKRQEHRIVYLEVLESPQLIRYSAQVGEFRSLYTSSGGKAILGSLPQEQRDELIAAAKFKKFTAKSITTRAQFEKEIEQSRKRGWYLNDGEVIEDLMAVAIPLQWNDDWYGLSICGPIHRMRPELKKYVEALEKAVKKLAE